MFHALKYSILVISKYSEIHLLPHISGQNQTFILDKAAILQKKNEWSKNAYRWRGEITLTQW